MMPQQHYCNSSANCSCGMSESESNSFTMLFANHHPQPYDYYPITTSSSSSHYSSQVDCTLSLGTPSTRVMPSTPTDHHQNDQKQSRGTGTSRVSKFCWDLLHPKQSHNQSSPKSSTASRGGSGGVDPLLARRCANCDTTSTPLWRNGPRGPKSLCNACGIRYKKEERRATAAAATTTNGGEGNLGTNYHEMEQSGGQYMFSHQYSSDSSWLPSNGYHNQYSQSASQKLQCLSPNEFRFIEDDVNGGDLLSWRLNICP